MRRKIKQDAGRYAKNYVPPRSMTKEEKSFYDKHKTLAGFYSTSKPEKKP